MIKQALRPGMGTFESAPHLALSPTLPNYDPFHWGWSEDQSHGTPSGHDCFSWWPLQGRVFLVWSSAMACRIRVHAAFPLLTWLGTLLAQVQEETAILWGWKMSICESHDLLVCFVTTVHTEYYYHGWCSHFQQMHCYSQVGPQVEISPWRGN